MPPIASSLPKQSTLTGLAACLFTAGVVALFLTLYREAGNGPLLWLAIVLLIATVACWIASARAGERGG